MFGRRKRDRVVVLRADERRLLTAAMLAVRNKRRGGGKATEDVNELLIRLMKEKLNNSKGASASEKRQALFLRFEP